jgi:hypothetical protein
MEKKSTHQQFVEMLADVKKPVQISEMLLTQIKERKKTTGITITAFVEQAIQDKLSKTK